MAESRRILQSAQTGTVDPTSVTPDFVGQLYENTTTDKLFFAKTTTIGDWELLTSFIDLIADNILTDISGETVQDKLDEHELEITNLETDSHTHANKSELDLLTDGDHDIRLDNPHDTSSEQVAFVPQTGSALTSNNVEDAINELEQLTGGAVPIIKTGIVDGSEFFSVGGKQIAIILFTTPFPSGTEYTITVTGTAERTWTTQNKSEIGFTINSGSNKSVLGAEIYFQAIELGEF